MSLSAFGVEHGDEISKDAKLKKEPNYTTGRAVTATLLNGPHGLIAGKKGKKIKAGLIETAGGVGGAMAGTAVDMATRGATRGLAGTAGAVGGSYAAFRHNNKRGYYKKQG